MQQHQKISNFVTTRIIKAFLVLVPLLWKGGGLWNRIIDFSDCTRFPVQFRSTSSTDEETVAHRG
jgi:hypothetical protein